MEFFQKILHVGVSATMLAWSRTKEYGSPFLSEEPPRSDERECVRSKSWRLLLDSGAIG